jgi:aspartyl protease family protein
MRQNGWTWAALVALALVGLLYYLNSTFPGALDDDSGRMRLVSGLGWLVLIGSSAIVGWRHNAGMALKQALAWIAIALVLVVIYNLKDDLMGLGGQFGHQVVSSLAPHKPVQAGRGVVYLSRDMGGDHFRVDAVVNGHVMNFLIDTGASDVALSVKDARRLGFDPQVLNYTQTYRTANGMTRAAPVTLDTIKVGDITVHNVRGAVMQGDVGISLLGMSFLNALGSYEFKGERLVLRR